AHLDQTLTGLVPVACTRHYFHVANATSVPGHLRQFGTPRAGHHSLRLRQFLPLDSRTAVARVGRRRLEQVGIRVELADQVQPAIQSAALLAALLTTLLGTEASQFVRSIVPVTAEHEGPLPEPAQQQAAKLSQQVVW